jgi:NAD(P)-dependent dehydrogenase (short-subunit alcohol dehydrogenase family)
MKTILITGGSRGIGREAAILCTSRDGQSASTISAMKVAPKKLRQRCAKQADKRCSSKATYRRQDTVSGGR